MIQGGDKSKFALHSHKVLCLHVSPIIEDPGQTPEAFKDPTGWGICAAQALELQLSQHERDW